jgi:hypothetical protein
MKLCDTKNCGNKIKNSYTFCYDCNKDNNSVCSDTIYKKEPICKTVRNVLWFIHYGDVRTAKCKCCLVEDISINCYHVGHVIAEANGGKTSMENLLPMCMLCNTSIGKQNVNDFIKKWNLHYRITN